MFEIVAFFLNLVPLCLCLNLSVLQDRFAKNFGQKCCSTGEESSLGPETSAGWDSAADCSTKFTLIMPAKLKYFHKKPSLLVSVGWLLFFPLHMFTKDQFL